MPSEFYHENWDKANEWIHTHAPKYVLDVTNEAFGSMSRCIERREKEIEFLYKLIEKYLTHLPDEAKQELITHYKSQQLVGRMVEDAETDT